MKAKIIAIELHDKLLNSYKSDIDSFYKVDIPNLSYLEVPTLEFSDSIEQAKSLKNNPSRNNISILTICFLKELEKANKIDIAKCRESKLLELYPITSHYHLSRIYLDVIFQHIMLFKASISFKDVEPMLSTLNDWYTKEMSKVSPEMSREKIEIKLALCLVRKANLFARCLAAVFPKEMENYPLLTKPLTDAFL